MGLESALLSSLHATLSAQATLILNFLGFEFFRRYYLNRKHLLHGRPLFCSSDAFDFNSPVEASGFSTLSLIAARSHFHKVNIRQDSELAHGVMWNRTNLTLLRQFSRTPLPGNAISLRSICDPRPSDLTIDTYSLCPVCDTPSTRSCLFCDQNFCATHIYICADCTAQFCGDCLDAHRADGHWSDSDTAAELAHTQHSNSRSLDGLPGRRPDSSLGHHLPDLAANNDYRTQASWIAPLAVFRSLFTLFFVRLTASNSGACL